MYKCTITYYVLYYLNKFIHSFIHVQDEKDVLAKADNKKVSPRSHEKKSIYNYVCNLIPSVYHYEMFE